MSLSRSRSFLLLALLVGAFCIAFHSASAHGAAPPDAGPYDASMSMAVPVLPAVTAIAAPVAPSFDLWAWVVAHQLAIAMFLGAWALVASIVNQKAWPKPSSPPASRVSVVLHYLLIDGVSFLASKDMQGVYGRFNLPLIPSFDKPVIVGDKPPVAALLPFLLLAGLASQACGGIIPASKQALAAGEHLESTAISALEQADKIRQHEIVDPLIKAHKPDEAEAAVAAYRKQRAPVVAAITHTATITSLLATAIPLVDIGVKAVGGKPIDLPALLSDLFASLTSLRSTLAEFGVNLGGK